VEQKEPDERREPVVTEPSAAGRPRVRRQDGNVPGQQFGYAPLVVSGVGESRA